ncbi:hypothetical protein BGZ98_002407, partial [Dissophora globulifera]
VVDSVTVAGTGVVLIGQHIHNNDTSPSNSDRINNDDGGSSSGNHADGDYDRYHPQQVLLHPQDPIKSNVLCSHGHVLAPEHCNPVRCRNRSASSPLFPRSYATPSPRVRANSCFTFDRETRASQDSDEYYHGPSAFQEEEAALEYAAELAALKAGLRRTRTKSNAASTAGAGIDTRSRSGVEQPLDYDGSDEEEAIEEDDHDDGLTGICAPQSQFFITSVMCSNTMTRDGLANERTYLAWLNTCNALCLVSFTFFSRALSLEIVNDNSSEGHDTQHKDRLSKAIGYVCFISAFLATLFSLFKYLRNIRRISTRYPFAQAGKWTFTVGMFFGILIMSALVIAYTTHL